MARTTTLATTYGALVMLVLGTARLQGDQVEMQNGDRYLGEVMLLDTNALVLRSDVLGTVRLPRAKVAVVTLGASGAAKTARPALTNHSSSLPSVPLTNGTVDLSGPLRKLGADTNFIQQIQAQFLADAGPEANHKFTEMVGGLLSGKLTVNDIRAEAKSAADQLKELKRDLGGDDGGALDGYLSILEHFLRETAPSGGSTTNTSRPLPLPKPKPDPIRAEE
jgi:hypothetical protein